MKPAIRIAVTVVLIGLGYILLRPDTGGPGRGPAPEETLVIRAQRGPVAFHLTETGVLQARQSITLASELPSNRAKIVGLAPEGALVRKGEVVAEFDPTPFEEDVAAIEKEYDEAQGALAQVEQELQLEMDNAKIAQEERKHEIRMAEIKLDRLKQVEIPLRIARAQQELQEARDKLAEARQRLEDLRDLLRRGYGKRRELEAVERETGRLHVQVEYLEKRHQLLKEKGGPAEIRLAGLEVEALRRKAVRDERVAQHKIALKSAALLRARARFDQLAARLEKARGLLGKTVIRAPVSGFVMLRRIAVQGETRKVQIGDSVWFRNGFITLPDMSGMVVELAVREMDLGRLARDQSAEIRPSAWPDLLLSGYIDSIGTLSRSGGDRHAPRFRVRVRLDRSDPRLRPGMTALVRILTDRLDDAVTVPVDAVFHRRDKAYCLVDTPLGVRETPVIPGATDGVRVIIQQGLEGGERLRLLPPESGAS